MTYGEPQDHLLKSRVRRADRPYKGRFQRIVLEACSKSS
jgi:hypothetical protein